METPPLSELDDVPILSVHNVDQHTMICGVSLLYRSSLCLVSAELGHPAHFVGVSQGSRLWEHNKTPQYTLSPSWPYRMPQNFIQQGNGGYQPAKPFMAQGQTEQAGSQSVHIVVTEKLCSCKWILFCKSRVDHKVSLEDKSSSFKH